MAGRVKAGFIEPMLLLRTEMLPADGERWEYQLKFDGYRAIAFKTGGILPVRSRNDNDLTGRYPTIVQGLAKLPNETVIDGDLVDADVQRSADAGHEFRGLHRHEQSILVSSLGSSDSYQGCGTRPVPRPRGRTNAQQIHSGPAGGRRAALRSFVQRASKPQAFVAERTSHNELATQFVLQGLVLPVSRCAA